MALREILTEPNAILREKSLNVDMVDKDLQKLMDDMLETMYAAPGIGLACHGKDPVGIVSTVRRIQCRDGRA